MRLTQSLNIDCLTFLLGFQHYFHLKILQAVGYAYLPEMVRLVFVLFFVVLMLLVFCFSVQNHTHNANHFK